MNHRRVARLTLALGALSALAGGALAMLLRWQLAFPGRPVPLVGAVLFPVDDGAVGARRYAALLTAHGTVMIFFALGPMLIQGLSTAALPRLCGRDEMALPRWSVAALALQSLATLLLAASALSPLGGAMAGWIGLAPLSTDAYSPGFGTSLWLLSLLVAVASTLAHAANTVATVVTRPRSLPWTALPLAAWGWFFAAALNLLFAPVLAAASALLLSDRALGTRRFIAAMGGPASAGGDPLLHQHLFWVFGHPEVYVLILPVWGIVADALSHAAERPPAGYRAVVASMAAVTALSGAVYGHHLFATGLSAGLAQAFMALTLVISLPSSVFVWSWAMTARGGLSRPSPASRYALATAGVFAAGGLTGLHLGVIPTDLYLHDTHFVVGHLHLVMAASLLFGLFTAVHHFAGDLLARPLSPRVARWHLWLSLVGALVAFGAMLRLGFLGMPRRVWSVSAYRYLDGAAPWNLAATAGAYLLGAAQLLLVVDLTRARRGAP